MGRVAVGVSPILQIATGAKMMSKKPYRKRRKKKTPKQDAPPLPDRRSMDKTMADISRLLEEKAFDSVDDINAYLQQLLASGQPIPAAAPRTPLEEAQAVMYDAWDAQTPKQRIRLARKALSISQDCADAYVLLAEESARSVEEAKELFEAGVKAGERALGEEAFVEDEGHFWGVTKTRPYMRARAGLAACLWRLDQHAEAIAHYREMLRLNPGDNQGIRYTLLPCLLEEGKDEEAEKLMNDYDDDAAAMWLYTAALLAFRQEGASRKANERLREALAFNPHVPDYLLDRRRMPRQLPPHMGLGDETEAAYYVAEAGHLWVRQDGALDWLRQKTA